MSTNLSPKRMGFSADIETLLPNECVPRGVLGQHLQGTGLLSLSVLHLFLLLFRLLKRIQEEIVFLHWAMAVGVRFSVRSYTALIEQPSVKSSCEEIISPLRSVPFCCNCVHLIELKETTSFLRISIEVSKIKLSYNYTCFHITLLLASSRVCLKH